MTTAYKQPYTYSQAVRMAEDVTIDELIDLLKECSGVTILQRNHQRRHATSTKVIEYTPGHYSLMFEYCTPRSGYTETGYAVLSAWAPYVFDFYNQERVVKISATKAAS